MKTVESYLTSKLQRAFPDALVYHNDGSDYVLERLDQDPLLLGRTFKEANTATNALLRAHAARGTGGTDGT